ncbi:MAG: hypothetical protein Q9194_007331 [Teloschistes cf. exilis]
MGPIFERAFTVQIWLGPDVQGHAQHAFDLCTEIDDYYGRGVVSSDDEHMSWYEAPPPPASDNPILDPTRWVHLESLSRCSWFERLWVVQEAGVARTAHVSWGNTGIKFSHLIEAFIYMRGVGTTKQWRGRHGFLNGMHLVETHQQLAALPGDSIWYNASLRESTKQYESIKTDTVGGARLLHTRGIVFDIVDGVSVVFEKTKPWISQHPVEAGLSLMQWPNNPEALDALSLVMVIGLQNQFETSRAAEEHLDEHRARFVAHCLAEKTLAQDIKDSLVETYQLHPGTRKQGDGVEHYQELLYTSCSYRRLFMASKNDLLGLGPSAMQQADLCCILFGSDVPFVIRRSSSQYKLVGECYIHGVMRGEIVEEMLKGQRVFEDIVLS